VRTCLTGLYYVDLDRRISFLEQARREDHGLPEVRGLWASAAPTTSSAISTTKVRSLCVEGCPLTATMHESAAAAEATVYLHHKQLGTASPVSIRTSPVRDETVRDRGRGRNLLRQLESPQILRELEALGMMCTSTD